MKKKTKILKGVLTYIHIVHAKVAFSQFFKNSLRNNFAIRAFLTQPGI